MPTVTIEIVESILRQWQAGQLTAAQVHEWAENTYQASPWEPESEAVNEVLANLDMLNINLVTPEDIPTLLAALRADNFEALLSDHFATVDLASRRSQLAAIPLYARFCGRSS